MTVLAAVLAAGAIPCAASARWTRVSRLPSSSEPYFACPGGGQRLECQLIEDPTTGSNHRGPVAEGAITHGPAQEVSPALFGSGVEGGYSPADLRSAYALPSESAGSGQTVAVVDAFDDPNAEADLTVYRSHYGIPSCTAGNGCFSKVDQSGGASYPPPERRWAGEIALDLDMVSAICPNCHILLVEANDNTAGSLAAAEEEAVVLGATEVSNSFGAQISSEPPQFASAYDHPGVPITAAGGDHGYGVDSPAANPHVIAVGGTTLVPVANSRGWGESVWYFTREGEAHGTGSGCSEEAKPSWQRDPGCSFRTTNDVAAVADPNTPVSVYDSYETSSSWRLVGGTSASTPIIAASMALADEFTRSFDGAQALYIEAAANGTGALDDVTSGFDGSCGNYLCEAGPGYDGPTGLGSPYGAPGISASQVHAPTAVTESATAVTQSSATLNASVNPHGEAITRCFFTFSSAQSSVPCATLPGSEQAPVHVSGSVTGLIAGTTYSFRIVAMNPSGTTYGAVQTLTTPGAPSFQPPAAAPPQTPSGALPPPLAPAVIASTTVRSSSSGVVGVKVSCPTAYPVCAGTIVLRTLRAVNASGHGKKRVLLLAAGPFKLTGGHSAVVKLRLATKARALLRHAHQLRARASIAFADATGAVHTTQTIVTIRLVAQRGH